jgi:hypothetical protein
MIEKSWKDEAFATNREDLLNMPEDFLEPWPSLLEEARQEKVRRASANGSSTQPEMVQP